MLNYIWSFFIFISVIFSIINNSFEEVNSAIINQIPATVELCIKLLRNDLFLEWYFKNNIINKFAKQTTKTYKTTK